VRGYAGELQKWQFLTMGKANNRCCLATFSIVSAKRLMKSEVKKLNGYNVTTDYRFTDLPI
jgi:hypothetical protein